MMKLFDENTQRKEVKPMLDNDKTETDVKDEEVEETNDDTVEKTDVHDSEEQSTSEQPTVPEKPLNKPETENTGYEKPSAQVETERNDDMPKYITKDENGKFDYSNCKTYVTKRGDTLFSVAQEFGVPMQQLRYFNGLAPQSRLPIGRKLYIPDGIVDIPNGE